jgi:type I restriction enzyme S subunit
MSYKTDKYNREGITYKISRDGISLENCITKIYGKFFMNDTALTLNSKKSDISDMYIGEILVIKKDIIYNNCTRGSAQLHISIDGLLKFKIKIPKDKQLIEDMKPLFEKIEGYQKIEKEASDNFNELLEDLRKESIKE